MAKNWNPCPGVGKVVPRGEYERTTGLATAGAWAKTRCPDCGRKVGATRPTMAQPAVLISMHHLAPNVARPMSDEEYWDAMADARSY